MADKNYSFINLKKAVGKENKTYTAVTLEALVTKPDTEVQKSKNGKEYVKFTAPINGRSKYIAKMCDNSAIENEEAVFANVSLFNSEYSKLATRFTNLLSKNSGKTVILIITGAISVNDSEYKGKTYHNVNIIADDFTVAKVLEKKGFSEEKPSETKESSFIDIADDDDIPF